MDTSKCILRAAQDRGRFVPYPISEHHYIGAGVAAGKHRVDIEDFGYGPFADSLKVVSLAEGRIGYREGCEGTGG